MDSALPYLLLFMTALKIPNLKENFCVKPKFDQEIFQETKTNMVDTSYDPGWLEL